MAWFLNTLGPSSFPDVWEGFRPIMGWIFQVTTSIFGDVPWRWQVFGLITRWLSIVSLWWALRQLWPKRTTQVTLIGLLFAVYPGFRQQSISLIYSHYFLVMTLFHISLGTMLQAIRSPNRFWPLTGISLLTGAISMFSMEFFFGLEFLRPLLLWLVLVETEPSSSGRLRKTVIHWLPFLALILVYIPWRIYAIEFKVYKPELLTDLVSNMGMGLLTLLKTIAGDIYEAGFLAWQQAVIPPNPEDFGLRSTMVYWGLVGFTALVVLVYLAKSQSVLKGELEKHSPTRGGWPVNALLVGALALLVGGWPFWITKLPLQLYFPWDRFTLGMMFGACLLLVGFLEALTTQRIYKLVVVAVLVGLATGSQFRAGNSFRRAWEAQRRFYWQLTWRIPGLKPNTLIMANELPIDYVTDNSLTGPINWMYAPEFASREMPYMLYDVEKRLGLGLKGLDEGLPIYQPYKSSFFAGSTSQVLVMHYLPPGCLRVVDQILEDSSPIMPLALRPAVHLSRLDLIDVDANPPAQLPAHLQGPEPVGTWCYYYEKADLARQKGDWEQIVEWGEVAFNLDDKPNLPEERIPFIEAYGHVGQWQRASELTLEVFHQPNDIRRPLCHVWERLESDTQPNSNGEEVIREMLSYLECLTP